MRIRIDTDAIKQHTNLIDLASQYTTLRREATSEWSGPCPRCGGDDRFHCTTEWFFCRQCHPERGDAIEFIRWLHDVDFKQACEMLAGGSLPKTIASTARHRQPVAKCEQPSDWTKKAETLVGKAQVLLAGQAGRLGREYLEKRSIDQSSWSAFGLGYLPDVSLPDSFNQTTKRFVIAKQPAIVIPWLVNGEIRAVRYRFLKKHTYTDADGREREEVKQKSEFGSDFSGILFGGQSHDEANKISVLCEGELNAISIWQATAGLGINVFSIGSQDAKLSDQAVKLIKRKYDHVLVWADQQDRVESLQAILRGAFGFKSPFGKDANDWLVKGKLRRIVESIIEQMVSK